MRFGCGRGRLTVLILHEARRLGRWRKLGALVGGTLAGRWLDGLCLVRVLVAAQCNLGADRFGERLWRTAGPPEEITIAHMAALLDALEVREINERRSSITQVRKPGIRSDA